jgi:uncharacterized protein (TIGR03437 family)
VHVTLRFLWITLICIVSCRGMPQVQSRAGSGKPRAARTVSVTSTGDLQPALDAAEPGDTIELLAGAAFSGSFRLPAKTSNRGEFITLRSSAVDRLPAGVRVTPLAADWMPRLVTTNSEPALVVAQGSHNWRIIGLEFTTGRGVYAYDVIRVGDVDATSATSQPREIEFDRIYVHAHAEKGSKRGIFFNSNAVKLTNSYISEFKSEFQDAMAVAVCNGPGPYEISNNYLEGAGYSIIFGGCENGIIGVVPSDITFTRNHLFKPLSWQREKWVIKNIFEVKMGRRIRIEGNVFENNWTSGQSGFGILFTVRANGVNAEGKPFSLIEDVTFANNKVINSAHGINILGQDDYVQNAGQGRRLTFRNNLFVQVPGRLFQVLQNPQDVVIEKNTALSQDSIIVSENVTTGFVMRDNLFALGTYGIFGSGLGSGNNVLKTNFPGAIVTFNGFLGDSGGAPYPTGNTYLKKVEDARFVNLAANNLRLQANSPFRGKGQNGADPGADMDVLEAATLNVSSVSSTPRIAAVLNTVDHTSRVAPGGIVSILGSSLATSTVSQDTAPLPTALVDTTVTMDGQAARLLYVSPEEIQAQIPSTAIAGRDLEVRIAYRGAETEPFISPGANVKEAAPAILNYSVPGSDVIWAMMKQANGKWNGPLGGGLALHPSERGTLLVAGLGPTTPRVPDGDAPPPGAPAKPDSAVELYVNDLVQQIDSVTALLDAIGLFEIQFLLDAATPIGALDENWIRISTQNLQSVPRRVQLAQPRLE